MIYLTETPTYFRTPTKDMRTILRDKGWKPLRTCLNYGIFKGPKKNSIMEFKADKPLQLVGQAAEFKFESKFRPLQVIWQSLPKAFPDKRKF